MNTKLLACMLILFSFTLKGQGDSLSQTYDAYPWGAVLSDSLDGQIPKGHYVLRGQVSSLQDVRDLIMRVVITPKDQQAQVIKDGYFELLLPISSDYVWFRSFGYQESAFESYQIHDQHRITVQMLLSQEDEDPVYLEKPVVYGYSDKDQHLKIQLKTPGAIQFSYPKLNQNQSWNLSLIDNEWVDQHGKHYPYLFWDAQLKLRSFLKDEHQQIFGCILTSEEILPYLEEKLSYLGLNSTEQTDFITYWAPRMSKSRYCFVQFAFQEDCQIFSSYQIDPAPEKLFQLYLLFQGFEEYPKHLEVNPQKWPKFQRSGFHLLEWGGLEINDTENYD
ncbi:MAG: hypothetical protein EP338_01175 [Bacteroidetes bacterium]|nr:MAG: hypothetical protein EP338_01175 [Bacteroidota bacterium]